MPAWGCRLAMNECDIFMAALDIESADGRLAFLNEACGNDGTLRSRVEALLASHSNAGTFLDAPAFDTPAFAFEPVAERAGTVIGPYRLLEQIGEGGFGVVYLAEQTQPVRRKVALKIIKPGMDTKEVIARFEAERQALALMDHPNIAKVLDAGTTGDRLRTAAQQREGDGERGRWGESDRQACSRVAQSPPLPLSPSSSVGRPYFVMELVQGVPITNYCDQCNLMTRERLELFITVCQAVQHAHQKGVIHRDLKPTNVLVAIQDCQPAPKIIDFGVAKALHNRLTEETLATGFAQMLGTPMYMSPEQAELSPLGVDTRSDIYSLGVLLYELLTGTTPFDKDRFHSASYDELRRIIREEDPPRPSTRFSTMADDLATTVAERQRSEPRKLLQTLRGDLDWIVMRCLDKDRSRRYPTANALAGDVQRYLSDKPVEACRPTQSYLLKKFVRRNKVAVLAGSAMASLVLSAIVILLVSNARIRREATARERALEAKDAALREKDSALETAREAVDQLLTKVADERFSDMPLSHPLRIALLEDAMAFYERLAGQMGADPSLRCEIARVLHTNAGLLREVGDYDAATRALRQSSELLQSLTPSDSDPPSILQQLALVELDLAFTLHRGDETALATNSEAQAQYRRAIELANQLERQWPGHSEPPLLGFRMLAKVAASRGELKAALRLWRDAISRGEAYIKKDPDNINARTEIGWACVHLCDALGNATQSIAEAESVLTRGLKVTYGTLEDDPKSTRALDVRAALQIRLATLKCRQGRSDEALPLYEKAVAGMETLCEGFPWNSDYWNSLRWFHQEIAANLPAAGAPTAAQHALQQFDEWLERVSPQMSKDASQRQQIQQSQQLVEELLRSLAPAAETTESSSERNTPRPNSSGL
jgi:eukaryotic-like serine/threonine-protein kinase